MSIIMSDTTIVMILVHIWRKSVEIEALIVSMSYDMRLIMSPVWLRSKKPTGSLISLSNTS